MKHLATKTIILATLTPLAAAQEGPGSTCTGPLHAIGPAGDTGPGGPPTLTSTFAPVAGAYTDLDLAYSGVGLGVLSLAGAATTAVIPPVPPITTTSLTVHLDFAAHYVSIPISVNNGWSLRVPINSMTGICVEQPFFWQAYVQDRDPSGRGLTLYGSNRLDWLIGDTPEIVITEIMQNPAAVNDSNGEWVELFNPNPYDVDIQEWVLRDDDFDFHSIATQVVIPAGGYVTLGIDGNSLTNGGVTHAYTYGNGDFFLGNGTDEVVLETYNGVLVDRVDYDNGATFPDPTGASMSLDPSKLNSADNDMGANWCEATSTFGDGDLGTPGAANDVCTVPPV